MTPALFVALVSADVAAQVARAIGLWRRELQRDGIHPGAELADLEAAFGSVAVRNGQERSTLGDPDAGLDASPRRRDWLGVKEVAVSMNLSESTVRRLVRSGALASVTAGSRRLIHADTVASYGRSVDA